MKHATRGAQERDSLASIPGEIGRRTSAVAPRSNSEWDSAVVADILGFEYARAVVFTDGLGRVLFWGGTIDNATETAEALDIALSALHQGGAVLGLGELDMCVWLYRGGTAVVASTSRVRAIVLAKADVNLPQLLSNVRRIFAGRHE